MDLGFCYICGAPMATNADCWHCALWARVLDTNARATAEGRPPKQNKNWENRKQKAATARKPQRQPGPVVTIGDKQLPPTDR